MIQHMHSLLCVRAILDQNSGLGSYIDILDRLELVEQKDTIRLPPFNVISRYYISDDHEDNEDILIDISRKNPKTNKRTSVEKITVPIQKIGCPVLVQLEIANMTLENDGLWEFHIKWKQSSDKGWKKGTVIPLLVEYRKRK